MDDGCMRIAVVGLGAVGGFLAARLHGGGHAVSALARGARLAAVRADGLRLEEHGVVTQHAIAVSDQAAALGPQDLVILAVKAPALADAVACLPPLLGPDTPVLTAMNGVPWWFLQTLSTLPPDAGTRLSSIDRDGRIAQALPLVRVVAGVVHCSCSMPQPGLVRHGAGARVIVGEPAGGLSVRVERIRTALARGGLQAESDDAIRRAIWFKLWGNMTVNPVSALTGVTADRIIDDPLVRAFCVAAMAEARAIGHAIGCPIAETEDERLAVGRSLGAFKTSMLQDVEAGRPIELDAMVGSVHEIGRKLGVVTPNIDALLGLTRLMAAGRGLLAEASGA